MFRVAAFVLLLVVLAGLGVGIYNAGLAAGVNQAVQSAVQEGQPVAVTPYAYGPYWHGGWGFGFFGIFFLIFGIFLIIGLLRAAFGWGRGGRAGWSRSGYGPGGWYGSDRVSEWHRELHRREAEGEQGTSVPGDAGEGGPSART
jgi:hypothetical protein